MTTTTHTPAIPDHLRPDQVAEYLNAHGWLLRAFEDQHATLLIGLCKVYYMDGQWRATLAGKSLVYIGSSLEQALKHALGVI